MRKIISLNSFIKNAICVLIQLVGNTCFAGYWTDPYHSIFGVELIYSSLNISLVQNRIENSQNFQIIGGRIKFATIEGKMVLQLGYSGTPLSSVWRTIDPRVDLASVGLEFYLDSSKKGHFITVERGSCEIHYEDPNIGKLTGSYMQLSYGYQFQPTSYLSISPAVGNSLQTEGEARLQFMGQLKLFFFLVSEKESSLTKDIGPTGMGPALIPLPR